MGKYKITFEKNEITSCKRTTQFIGDKGKKWEEDVLIYRQKEKVIILIRSNNSRDAILSAIDIFNKMPVFQNKL